MKLRLFLNPDCPRFATAPVQEDGRFDNDRFGKLLQMQEGGATLDQFVETMRGAQMEDVPLVRQRQSALGGIEIEGYECHPEVWQSMPEDFREKFLLVNGD